jgi:hypothetical protein
MFVRTIAAVALTLFASFAFAGQCETKGECKEQLATVRAAVKAEKAEARMKAKAAKEVAAVEKMRAQIAALQSKATK